MPLFVDTNLLVYTRDASDRRKQERALDWMELLWSSGEGRLSTQVLQEFYVTVTRKLSPGLEPELARADMLDLVTWDPLKIDAPLLGRAWSIEDKHGLSFWDALIVAAAAASGCEAVLTEDLHNGASIDGVTVMNPFESPVKL